MIVVGDIRKELARDAALAIEKAINRGISKGLEDFYVTLISTNDPFESARLGKRVVRSRVILDTRKPHPWIGTVSYHITKKGDVFEHHILPRDIPLGGVQMSEEARKNVFDSAQEHDSPIVN